MNVSVPSSLSEDLLFSWLPKGWFEGADDQRAGVGASFAVSFKEYHAVRVGTWYVVSVDEGSTAYDAGLIAGDTVLKVLTYHYRVGYCMNIIVV